MHNLVPQFIVDSYQENRWNGRFFAVCLFADISGFSTITDNLMKHGPHGAETLAGLMRGVFDPLMGSVYEYGGFVATLAGDAFTAIFAAADDSESSRQDAAVRAIAAAWQIQRRMEQLTVQSTVYGNFDVSAKVGAADGEVNWSIIASDDQRRVTYYFEGPAINGSAQAEHAASAGEIILSSTLLKYVAPLVTTRALDGDHQDYLRLVEVGQGLPPSKPVSALQTDGDVMSLFFPSEIVYQKHSGEFRQILNLFISLPTIRTEDQLAMFMHLVFGLQDKYGGLLNRVDFGDKGSNLLLFWGAPVSHENDVARALNFILDLQANTSIPINAGVTYRIAHAGFVGSSIREEYTCYGRGVNLAARFMTAAARGEIWLDEYVARLAEKQFDIEYEGQMTFKGFAEKQKVYVLFEAKEDNETLYDGQMVGRQAEMGVLAEFVEPLWQGQPAGTMIVWGEPGMGKSRLVHEFAGSDLMAGADVLWALCQSDEILRESLNPFRYWLKRYFSQSAAQSEMRNKRSFNRQLDDLIAETQYPSLAIELDRTRSFLGAMLDLYWPDSLYAGLDASGRYENTLQGLQVLMQAESLRQPLIIQLEDMHLTDEASLELIHRLANAMKPDAKENYPIALIATSRLEGPGCPQVDDARCLELDLGQISRESLRELAIDMLAGPVSEGLLDLIESRAEGNPFFSEQLLRYLVESDLVLDGADGWQVKHQQRGMLPDDVRSVLNARLDRLAQEVKDVVQTAAVLGREFEVGLLVRMLRDESVIRERIAIAEHAAIWSALSQMRYIFRHTLLRDTAYRMQIRSRRQALHQLAVEALQTLYADDLRPHYGELAYHSERAGQESEAADWNLLAGEQAISRGTLRDSLNYYQQAEALLKEDHSERRWRALVQQITVLGMQGDTDTGKEKVLEALTLAQGAGDDAKIAYAHHQLGTIANMLGDDRTALAELNAGLAASERCGSKKMETLILGVKIATLARMGRIDEATIAADGALALSEELGDDNALARILNNLANLNMHTGDYGQAAEYLERQVELNRRRNDQVGVAFGLTNLAYNQLLLGLYSAAQQAIAEGLQLTIAMGAKRLSAYNRLNLGLAQVRLNQPIEAEQEIIAARQVLAEVDDKFGLAVSYSYMGLAFERKGRPGDAAASFETASEMQKSAGAAGYVIDATAGLGRCALLFDDLALAVQSAVEVWEYLQKSGAAGLEFPVLAFESCAAIFERAGNTQAYRDTVETGYRELMDRAHRISKGEWQDSYLHNVKEHDALIGRWERLDG